MFSGAMTAMVTPFRDGSVDEARLREQVEFQVKNGISALVPCGTTGESPTLDFKEHTRVIELSVQYAAGRVPVIAGTGANSTAEALELHSAAKEVGAAAGLSVVPYYNKPSQEGLYRHFMSIADKVDLPIVLYNIPGRTGITMSAATIARLSQHKNIVAVKESTGQIDSICEIKAACDITVISGDDYMTLPLMSLGASGVISVVSNLLPAQVARLVSLAGSGNFTDAATLHHQLYAMFKVVFLDGNPAGIKHAMKLAGMDSGELRQPLWEAGESTQQAISTEMKKLNLLP